MACRGRGGKRGKRQPTGEHRRPRPSAGLVALPVQAHQADDQRAQHVGPQELRTRPEAPVGLVAPELQGAALEAG